MRSVNIPYLPAVDHVRAFAALLILAYHGVHMVEHVLRFGQEFRFGFPIAFDAIPMALLIEGHTAVGLFMVLTGFVLTYGALSRDVRPWPFLRNRFLRTYPLGIFMLLFGIAMRPEQFSAMGLLRTLVGLANLPGALDVSPYSSMWWTVAVEWHFYVLFPTLLFFLKGRWARGTVFLIGVSLLARWSMILNGSNPRDLSYLTIVGRLDQFLLGMLAAHLFAARPLSRAQSVVLTVGGLVAMIVALYAFNRAGSWVSDAPWKIAWPTVEGVLWAITLLGYLHLASGATGWWSRALCAIGTISYSIYFTHFVVITLVTRRGWLLHAGDDTFTGALLTTTVIVLPITLAVSAVTYRFVERPFLAMRVRYYAPTRAELETAPA